MAKRMTRNRRLVAEWFATDKFLRIPGTQKELAKQLGIHETTVSSWRAELVGEINEISKRKMREELPQVLASLTREAIKGSVQHQKLYLDMVGELSSEDSPAVVIQIERNGISTLPSHLSPSANGGSTAEGAIQRVKLRPTLGENGAGY